MVAYQVFEIQDVATGLLFYVGQAFLLAGSIFGLSYYVDELKMKGPPLTPPLGGGREVRKIKNEEPNVSAHYNSPL